MNCLVVDPLGLEHRVVVEGMEVYGHDNLAHFVPREQRDAALNAIMRGIVLREEVPGFQITYED